MAEEESCKLPQSINTEESPDLTHAVVKLVIPDMAVEKKFFSAPKPKSGEADVDVKFDAMSLLVTAAITNRKQKSTTHYKYKVNQLPGEIDPYKCSVEYKKDVVTLKLWKKDTTTWAVLLNKNGLEQAPED